MRRSGRAEEIAGRSDESGDRQAESDESSTEGEVLRGGVEVLPGQIPDAAEGIESHERPGIQSEDGTDSIGQESDVSGGTSGGEDGSAHVRQERAGGNAESAAVEPASEAKSQQDVATNLSDKFKGEDNQGNPIDHTGKLIVEDVRSIDEITDSDFTHPTRSVGLPALPGKVSEAIGAEGRKPIIKRNIFGKNLISHKDLTPEDGRKILMEVLYNPDLYGQNKKATRPYNWILVHLADKNSSVILEVNPTKDHLEIVNWHYLNGRQLEQKKRQAEREGGRILTLHEGNAAGDTSQGLSSEGKDNTLLPDKQGVEEESSNMGAVEAPGVDNKGSLGELISEAGAEVNLSPTEAQKEAGNYKKGHVKVGRFDVSIENPAGSVRRGTDADGKKWETTTYPNIDAMADLFTEHNKRVKTAQDEVREGSGERTMTMNVNVGGIDFTINTRVSRKIANNGQLSFESERNMTYSCEALGMEDVPVSGSRLKAAIEDIVGNVMNGDLFRERIETANNSIERMNNEVSQLESQKGKPFEHVKELEEAESRLEEYTEKMKAELAEKEAKYADIDATVEAAEDVALVEDEEEEASEERKLYREMEAADEILNLEPIEVTANTMTRAELFSIYRGLRDITKDGVEIRFLRGMFGKKYKPGGLFAQAVPFLDDIFEESIFAYSEADQLGGVVRPDGRVHKAHPNIDTFDNYVGKMRLDGNEYYVRLTVQKTKDSTTGVHSCFVSNVDVYERTAPTGTDTTFIDRPNQNRSGKLSEDRLTIPDFSPFERSKLIVDAKLQQFFDRINLRQSKKEMEGAVKRLSEKLHSPIRVISRQEAEAEGYRRKKGWYDRKTGKISVVADNHRNVGDIADTAVHEAVGHHGLRQLFGTEEKLNNFLDEAYNIRSDKIREEIDRRTELMIEEETCRRWEATRKEREARGENSDTTD